MNRTISLSAAALLFLGTLGPAAAYAAAAPSSSHKLVEVTGVPAARANRQRVPDPYR